MSLFGAEVNEFQMFGYNQLGMVEVHVNVRDCIPALNEKKVKVKKIK